MKYIKKKAPQEEIVVCYTERLYCEDCQEEVMAQCITQDWYQHLSKSRYAKSFEEYHRRYVCLKCGAWVGCHKGTYTPLDKTIPSKNLRLGREMTAGLVYLMNKMYKYERDDLAQAIGFENYKEIKRCKDIKQLREGYSFGVKLKAKLKEMEGEK